MDSLVSPENNPKNHIALPQTYFETIIIPSDCLEIFMDFIIHFTNLALEEIPTNKLSQEQLQHIQTYNLQDSATIAPTAIILRSEQDPSIPKIPSLAKPLSQTLIQNDPHQNAPDSLSLIEALKLFSHTLSNRNQKPIGFAYTTTTQYNCDWIARYQASIEPITCGQFYIRPSWHTPQPHKTDIIIDPALAFGSGHHASTFMCIEFLKDMNLSNKLCLDVGCGSGILGIIMAKQGGIVESCDTDPLAIQESCKNFISNNVLLTNIWEGTLQDRPKTTQQVDQGQKVLLMDNTTQSIQQYDVICANIVADVIISLHDELKKRLQPKGILILSGILKEKASQVKRMFNDLQLIATKHKDEWVSLKFALIA